MKDFILAALPWVVCGIAVAIICTKLGSSTEGTEKKTDQKIALGMAMGLMLSPVINSIGLWKNYGIGIALSCLVGMAIAMLCETKESTDKK